MNFFLFILIFQFNHISFIFTFELNHKTFLCQFWVVINLIYTSFIKSSTSHFDFDFERTFEENLNFSYSLLSHFVKHVFHNKILKRRRPFSNERWYFWFFNESIVGTIDFINVEFNNNENFLRFFESRNIKLRQNKTTKIIKRNFVLYSIIENQNKDELCFEKFKSEKIAISNL